MSTHETILVGQSGGPTAAINASLAGVCETAHSLGASVLGMRFGIEGFLSDDVVDLNVLAADRRGLELLRQTPASYLGSCRYKLPDPSQDEAPYKRLLSLLDEHGITCVAYIGGNDSMDTTARLAAYGAAVGSDVRFVGVPKTIDNDLVGTDHTPGYGSAAKFIATCMRELSRDSDVYDLPSVTVVEIMGRNAGWLAAAASLATPADGDETGSVASLTLLPEVALREEDLVRRVRELLEHHRTIMIAASEGVRGPDGKLICGHGSAKVSLDAFGHEAALSGTGRYLAGVISDELGIKTRAVELSTLQRCASHVASATDLTEASLLGGAAVLAAHDGATGVMSALKRMSDRPYQVKTRMVDVATVANQERHVPLEWVTPDGMGLTSEFEDYARPLILGEVSPFMVDGLPYHLSLD